MKNIIITFLLLTLISCGNDYVPKPRGYFRIDLPNKEYKVFEWDCPYKFDIPVYSVARPYSGQDRENYCWLNVDYPTFKGRLHLSYFTLQNDLQKHVEDARTLVYKHTVRADAIDEIPVLSNKNKAYGLIYDIAGNAASPYQFYLTDSVKHFLRGALYFSAAPNIDSIAPVADFIKKDIEHLIQTLEWKN